MPTNDPTQDPLMSLLESLDTHLTKLTTTLQNPEPLHTDTNAAAPQLLTQIPFDNICQICAGPIGFARLKTIPFTTLCSKCASEMIHEGR